MIQNSSAGGVNDDHEHHEQDDGRADFVLSKGSQL
jgi:hypothetical protein